MATPSEWGPDDVNLSSSQFWKLPREERYAWFRRLRRERPVTFHPEPHVPGLAPGPGYWAVTRHSDVVAVTRNLETFSSAQGALTLYDLPPDLNEFYGSLINLDAPRHTRLRRIVSRAFTPKALQRLQHDIRRIAREVLDAVADRDVVDFATEIATPFPLIVVCELLGIPASHRAVVLEQSNIIASGGDREFIPRGANPVEAFVEAGRLLAEVMDDVADRRQATPGDDITSALVNATVDGERLSRREIVSFFILLTVAGHETTRTVLNHAAVALDRHPDQRSLLLADPTGGLPGAIEEILRFEAPVTYMRRTATRDIIVGGERIRAGEKLLLFYNSANHDEEVFSRPQRFDIRRSPNPHLSFGGAGPHFCLGAHLARHEIAVMLREFLARSPGFALAGEPGYLRSTLVNGITRLPVSLSGR